MITRTLDLKALSALLFCLLIYLLFFSVTYFSGNSLENQLSISGGERFFIPSSALIVMYFFIALTLFILKKSVETIKISFVFVFFIVIIFYKFSLSIFEDEDILFSFKANVFLLLNFLVFLLFFYIFGKDKYLSLVSITVYRFTILSVFVGFWMLLFGSFGFAFIDLTQFGGYQRLYSWYGNPNIMATSIGLTILIFLYGNFTFNKIGLFLLIIALAFTGSKGVISAFIITYSITSLVKFFYSKSDFSLDYKNLLLSIIFLTVLVYVYMQYSEFISSSLLRLDAADLSTASGRVDIWKDAIQVMNTLDDTKLIFGVGYGSFSSDFGKSAHSYYIKTIYEDGLLFILIFLIFLMFSLFKSIRDYKISGNGFYLCYFSITLFLIFRGVSSPTFFQDKLESYMFIIFLIPMFFKRKEIIS